MNDVVSQAACTNLIAAFAYYVDHREFDRAVALFAGDGRFERPDLVATGHAEIAAIWAGRPETMITRHVCSVPFFREATSERASSVTYFTLYQVEFTGDGLPRCEAPTALCQFEDEFVLTPAGWRIAYRRGAPRILGG